MALAVTNNMTTHCNGESPETVNLTIPTWQDLDAVHADFGRVALDALYTDDFYQGAGCMAWQASAAATTTGYVYTVASNIDLSSGFVRVTVKFGESNKMDIKANDGWGIVVVDSSGNYGIWTMGGSDTYGGAWEQHLVDCTTTFTNTSTTSPTMTAIRSIGVCTVYATKPARAETGFIDRIFYGTDPSITVTGTVTTAGDGWSELESTSQSTTNRYGVIRKVGGIYELQGGIKFGDGTGTLALSFSDYQNSKLFWTAPPIGSLDSASFIDFFGNGTGDTDFTLGSLVGTGDARQGYLGGILSSLGPRATIDAATNTASIESVEFYGVTFENLGIIEQDGSTTQEAITCTFLACYQFDPGAAEILSCFFVGTDSTAAALLWNNSINIKQCNFIANTTGAGVEHPSATGSPYTYTDLVFSGNTYDVNNTSGSAIEISKTGTSDPTNYTGSTVTFLGASVTIKATAINTSGTRIENALVLLRAASSSPTGPFPVSESVTIARTGSPENLAIVSHTGHGMQSNDKVQIVGASQEAYNGVKTITYIDANSYSFVVSTSPLPVTPATGTITATFVALYGLTNASGEISATRVYNLPQAVVGWARKTSATPFYDEGILTGTISITTGYDQTAVMPSDE